MNQIKDIIDRASEADAAKIKILHNAYIKNMRAAAEDGTAENVRNMEAAEAAYKKAIAPYDTTEAPEELPNKLEVWRFLQEDGWQISRSQFYEHCKDGLLRPDKKTGKYPLKKIEKYSRLHLRSVATGTKINDNLDKLQEKKIVLEVEQAEVKLAREKHDLGVRQKKFVPRDEFELNIVARQVASVAHLKHMIQTEAAGWVDLVAGDQARTVDLVAAMTEAVEQRLAVFSQNIEFDIIMEGDR